MDSLDSGLRLAGAMIPAIPSRSVAFPTAAVSVFCSEAFWIQTCARDDSDVRKGQDRILKGQDIYRADARLEAVSRRAASFGCARDRTSVAQPVATQPTNVLFLF